MASHNGRLLALLCALALLFTAATANEYRGQGLGTTRDLISIPCPQAIQATVPGYKKSYSTAPLHDQLLQCRDEHVRSLNLRITGLGCSEWPVRWNLPFTPGDKGMYPNLTALKVEGYRFGEVEWKGWGSVSIPKIGGRWGLWRWDKVLGKLGVGRKTNLEMWTEVMDWRQLRHVHVVDAVERHFVDVAMPKLEGLKKLGFRTTMVSEYVEDAVEGPEIIRALPDGVVLESLKWVGPRGHGHLEEVLKIQGKGLQKLNMAEVVPRGRHSVTLEEAEAIVRLAPDLEYLNVMVNRNGTWPVEILQMLGKLPKLQRLEVGLELESECIQTRLYGMAYKTWAKCKGIEYRQPLLDKTSAEQLLDIVEGEGGTGGRRLHSLTLYTGDFARPWDGPMLIEEPWYTGQSAKFRCSRVGESLDGDNEGFKVCTGEAWYGAPYAPDWRPEWEDLGIWEGWSS